MQGLERAVTINNRGIKKEKQNHLQNNLKVLIEEESRTPGASKYDICTLKSQPKVLDQEPYHKALVRARAENFFWAKHQRIKHSGNKEDGFDPTRL